MNRPRASFSIIEVWKGQGTVEFAVETFELLGRSGLEWPRNREKDTGDLDNVIEPMSLEDDCEREVSVARWSRVCQPKTCLVGY